MGLARAGWGRSPAAGRGVASCGRASFGTVQRQQRRCFALGTTTVRDALLTRWLPHCTVYDDQSWRQHEWTSDCKTTQECVGACRVGACHSCGCAASDTWVYSPGTECVVPVCGAGGQRPKYNTQNMRPRCISTASGGGLCLCTIFDTFPIAPRRVSRVAGPPAASMTHTLLACARMLVLRDTRLCKRLLTAVSVCVLRTNFYAQRGMGVAAASTCLLPATHALTRPWPLRPQAAAAAAVAAPAAAATATPAPQQSHRPTPPARRHLPPQARQQHPLAAAAQAPLLWPQLHPLLLAGARGVPQRLP